MVVDAVPVVVVVGNPVPLVVVVKVVVAAVPGIHCE